MRLDYQDRLEEAEKFCNLAIDKLKSAKLTLEVTRRELIGADAQAHLLAVSSDRDSAQNQVKFALENLGRVADSGEAGGQGRQGHRR